MTMEEFGSSCLAFGYFVAFLSNLECFKHIKGTYNVSQSLYYILALDALFVSIVSGIAALILGYKSLGYETGGFICSILLLGPYLSIMQAYMFGIISYVR